MSLHFPWHGKALKSLVASVLVLGLGAGVAACSGVDSAAEEGGPDRLPNASVYEVAFEKGAVFSDGFERVLLTGDRDAVLDRVEILGGDGYFSLEGLMVAGEDRRVGSIQFDPDFPPVRRGLGTLVEGDGARLATGPLGSLLIVGMRVTRAGIGWRSGLRVYYSVDGKDYFQDHPSAVVNCPPGTPAKECDAAFDEAFAEAQAIVD